MYKSLRAQTLHYFARPHEQVCRTPLRGPAAWKGADLHQLADWRVRLTAAECEELRRALRHADAGGKPMRRLTRQDFPLPTLSVRLAQWRQEIRHGRGFVLIQGVPVQDWTEAQAKLCYWGLGHYLGIPGAQSPEGDLLGHVRDERTAQDVRYYRTDKALAPHCDVADVVGLLCLKTAKQGGLSRIVSSVSVFNELLRRKPELTARLFEPLYFDTKGEGGIKAFPIPPCRFAEGELRTFWQSDYFRSAQDIPQVPRLTAQEHELLDAYDEIANSPDFYLEMDLQPGDIQLLSNHTILHSRVSFEDWPEPERRRHLLRLWISLREKRSLKSRRLIGQSWASLLATAAVELTKNRSWNHP
jgi:hypothetical protein